MLAAVVIAIELFSPDFKCELYKMPIVGAQYLMNKRIKMAVL